MAEFQEFSNQFIGQDLLSPELAGQMPYNLEAEQSVVGAILVDSACITQVMDIHRAGENALRVTYACDEGVAERTVQTPCVLSVGNSVIS